MSLDTARIFQTLIVAMSRFDFISSCALLGVDLSASYLVGSPPVLVGVPPFQVWHSCIWVLACSGYYL